MFKFKIIIIILCASYLFSSCSRKIAQNVEANQSHYYTCAMHSEVFTTKPGNCPKCGMTLVQWDPKSKPIKNYDSSHSGHSGSGSGGHNH
jgi:hypothetical protein